MAASSTALRKGQVSARTAPSWRGGHMRASVTLVIAKIDPRSWEMLKAVSRIDREAFGEEGLTPANIGLVAYSGAVYAIIENGEPLGEAIVMGGIGEPPPGQCCGSRAFLFSLAVTASGRRKGHGSRLLAHLIGELATVGVRTLELTVDPANLPAVDLYQRKFGFTQVAVIPELLGPGHPRLILRRSIP